MGHAVHCAQSPDEISAVDAYDGTIWEEVPKNIQCDTIVRVVEGGHEYQAVGDIEVRIAGGQPLTFKHERCGKRQFDDPVRLVVWGSSNPQTVQIFLERFEIFIVAVRFMRDHNRVRVDEAGDVIHMAMGIVSGDAPIEPYGLVHTKIVAEALLQLVS